MISPMSRDNYKMNRSQVYFLSGSMVGWTLNEEAIPGRVVGFTSCLALAIFHMDEII